MRFEKLKNLVKKLGGILVMDGERPEFVMLSYDKYLEVEAGGEEIPLVSPEANGRAVATGAAEDIEDQETIERLNQEILALKEEIRQKESAELIVDDELPADETAPVTD